MKVLNITLILISLFFIGIIINGCCCCPASKRTPTPTITPGPSPTVKPTKTPRPTSIPEPTKTPRPTSTPDPMPGDIWYVNCEGEIRFVAANETAYNLMMEGLYAKDEMGIKQLILKGQVYCIQEDPSVKILDIGWTAIKIRILEGNYKGYSAWTPREFLVCEKPE